MSPEEHDATPIELETFPFSWNHYPSMFLQRTASRLVLADSFCNRVLQGEESIREEQFYRLNLRVDSISDKMNTL